MALRSIDLMIGDWYAFRGHPYKCTASDIASIAECEEKGASTDISEIPLTPEILEKNGFEKQGFPGWEIYTEDFLILWRNDYPDILEIRSFNAAYGSFHRSHIGSVHELQHCLKLVGIEKEITL